MFRPRPGSVVPLYVVDLVVKKMSAKSSRAPNTLAHQAREVPQPSQVPYDVPGLTAIVASARAVPVARALPRRVPPAAVSRVLRRIMASPPSLGPGPSGHWREASGVTAGVVEGCASPF